MLESLNDFVSLIVIFFAVIGAIYYMFSVSDTHYHETVKARQEAYYSFIDDSVNSEDDSSNDPYYE